MFKQKADKLSPEVSEPFLASQPNSRLCAQIGYQRLEQRQVLSASFIGAASGLVLDSFDPGQDLLFVQTNALVNGVVQDSYRFQVDSGSWSGSTANPLVELESVNGGTNNRLEVATALFGGAGNAPISIDGATTSGGEVSFRQAGAPITFDHLDISNFTNQDQNFSLNTIGDITASNISVVDSNPFDSIAPSANLMIATLGSISTVGSIGNSIDNPLDGVRMIAGGQDNDIAVGGQIETRSGWVALQAGDSVELLPTGRIVSGDLGDTSIESGLNSAPGDSGDVISMANGSTIDVGLGQTDLIAEGDALVAEIRSLGTGDAVSIHTGGQIVDNSAAETNNIFAPNARIQLFAGGDIGTTGTGDIDIESTFLEFDSDGSATISDTDSGLTIDRTSRAAGGAEIVSGGHLTISQNISVGAHSNFITNNSPAIDDDLVINNGAKVSLSSPISAQLEFIAADDIIFDTGSIVTTAGNHSVLLIADTEDTVDADRGSISNSAGSNTTVSTNDFTVVAFDGIGDFASRLRTDVDRIAASNLGTGDIRIEEANSIELASVHTIDGTVLVNATGDIEATDVSSGETESTEDNSDNVELVSVLGSITVSSISSADELSLSAQDMITDNPASLISSDSNAAFSSGSSIELADSPSDALQIAGNANFSADSINVGVDFQLAGVVAPTAATVELGSLTLSGTTATVVEDDSTSLASASQVNELYLVSSDKIENQIGAALTVAGQAQFSAPNEIVLGNRLNDIIDTATAGFAADNVHIETDSDLTLGATAPDQSAAAIGSVASRGTKVSQTLFVTSTGSVNQAVGDLCAANIGIQAAKHVHLASVSANNQAIAIAAGTAIPLTDANLTQELGSLASLQNSEVNGQLDQSIAIKHRATLNATTVSSHLVSSTLSGLKTTDGSVFASAVQKINLIDDISANSNTHDPQATVFSEAGSNSNPGIEFVGGTINVNGPSNTGLVNNNQTFANFYDANGDPLPGTTTILLLNNDGTADQDIVAQYGHTGETGYRVGIVWDKDNQPGQPLETINTFVADPAVATEAYEDTIYQNNANTFLQIAGNEGGQETFGKRLRYSKNAIILHQDQPNVFSEVTVRNDQDINLFTGSLATTSNSLNETSEVLRAELDSPKGFAPDLPTINRINEIPLKSSVEVPLGSSSPDSSSGFAFSRDVQPFESGDLKWVQVQIPISELEEADGEVRLKNPTKVFGESDGSEINDLDDEIGENEVEKIIEVIEKNKKSEAGYWYKVFKDYRNRDDELFFYHFKAGESQQTDATNDSSESDTNDKKESDSDSINEQQKAIPSSDFSNGSQPSDDLFRKDGLQLQAPQPNGPANPQTFLTPNPDDITKGEMGEFEANEIESLFTPFVDQPAENDQPKALENRNEYGPRATELEGSRSLSPGSLLMASLLLKKSNARKIQREHLSLDYAKPDPPKTQTSSNKFSRSNRLKRRIKNLLGSNPNGKDV